MSFRSRVCFMICSILVSVPPAQASDRSVSVSDPTTPTNTILVLGDSLSAAYGLPTEAGWVARLQQRLHHSARSFSVHNASISGETTDGGLRALPGLLHRLRPAIVILGLGANDALRGFPLDTTRANLDRMVELSQRQGARVLLLGMHIPPNYGARYTQAFHALYGTIAHDRGTALVPFLLEGVATDDVFMQTDRMHPNAAGQPRILDTVWPHLQPLLEPFVRESAAPATPTSNDGAPAG
jgi:acyl-CoA thioesterase-1